MRARIFVRLRPGVLDPEGTTIQKALVGLGFGEVRDLRVGKTYAVELAETDRARAGARLDEMCRKLLANPVIEEYSIEVEESTG